MIGNQRQLEMRLNRQLADIEKLQFNVRQALTSVDQATAAGDSAKVTEYDNVAGVFAAQLVTSEQSVEDLKILSDQTLSAAAQAKILLNKMRWFYSKNRRVHQTVESTQGGEAAGARQCLATVGEWDPDAQQHSDAR